MLLYVQVAKSKKSLKRKHPNDHSGAKGDDQSGTISQRLRGPSGRKPAMNQKADYVYTDTRKENSGKVQSGIGKVHSQNTETRKENLGKVQSGIEKVHYQAEESETFDDEYETNSQRERRWVRMGKTLVTPAKTILTVQQLAEWEEQEEIEMYVNSSPEYMVEIDCLFIRQKHLQCLTNSYARPSNKYLGDEVTFTL